MAVRKRSWTRASHDTEVVKHWKIVLVILAACTGIAIYFCTWIFAGGWMIWWASGFAAGSKTAQYRPIIYAGWIFLFVCLGIDVYFVGKMIKTQGKGRYRFANSSVIIMLVTGMVAFSEFGGFSIQTRNTPIVVLPGSNPSTKVTIDCYTPASKANLVLEYHLNGSASMMQAYDHGDGMSHRFTIDGLLPNSTYAYHLATNTSGSQSVPDGMDQVRYFKTSPRNSTDGITFLSISDIHSSFNPELAARMASEQADLVVEAGDFTEQGSDSGSWSEYFQTGDFLHVSNNASHPGPLLLPAIGNHDTMFFGRSNFGRYFGGVGTGPDSPYWYRVDVGDVHFIVLDVEWGLESFSSNQEAWLRQSFASISPSDWTIVVTHCPIFSSGNNNGSVTGVAAKLVPMFKMANVKLVISGHDHHYERIVQDNITYMITATNYPDRSKHAQISGSQVYIVNQVMYGKYMIHGNTMTIQGIYVNGTITDVTTISK